MQKRFVEECHGKCPPHFKLHKNCKNHAILLCFIKLYCAHFTWQSTQKLNSWGLKNILLLPRGNLYYIDAIYYIYIVVFYYFIIEINLLSTHIWFLKLCMLKISKVSCRDVNLYNIQLSSNILTASEIVSCISVLISFFISVICFSSWTLVWKI